jgi:hypothetical protein
MNWIPWRCFRTAEAYQLSLIKLSHIWVHPSSLSHGRIPYRGCSSRLRHRSHGGNNGTSLSLSQMELDTTIRGRYVHGSTPTFRTSAIHFRHHRNAATRSPWSRYIVYGYGDGNGASLGVIHGLSSTPKVAADHKIPRRIAIRYVCGVTVDMPAQEALIDAKRRLEPHLREEIYVDLTSG